MVKKRKNNYFKMSKTSLKNNFNERFRKIYKNRKSLKNSFFYADKIDNQNIFSTPDNFLNFLKYNLNFPNEYIFIFIDEFQFIKNAWLFLKNIFDEYKDKLQIIVSWSSSLEISKNTEFLTWRAIDFYIDRISFNEFFIYNQDLKKIPLLKLDNFDEIKNFYNIFKQKLEDNFLIYLTYWWYPEIVINQDFKTKEVILSQIIETYIEKDIIHFLKIENILAFNNLIKLLSSNIWNLVNINELSSTLNISMQTLNKYLDILEWTFIFSRISPFFKNVRKELSKMPKIFIEDIWIKNYSLREFDWISEKIDLWAEVENFVYNELSKKFHKNQLFFYRTISKSEIDFIIEKSFENYILLEVKYKNKTWKKYLAMSNFETNYWKHKKIVITKDFLWIEEDIFYIPTVLLSFLDI